MFYTLKFLQLNTAKVRLGGLLLLASAYSKANLSSIPRKPRDGDVAGVRAEVARPGSGHVCGASVRVACVRQLEGSTEVSLTDVRRSSEHEATRGRKLYVMCRCQMSS